MNAEKSKNTATTNVVALRLRRRRRVDETATFPGMQDLANVHCFLLTILGVHCLKDALDLHLNILWILQQKIGNTVKKSTTHVFCCFTALMAINSTNDSNAQSQHSSNKNSIVV